MSATKTKPEAKPTLIEKTDRKTILAEYLASHDKQYWVDNTSMAQAVVNAPLPTNEGELRELVGTHCRFWLKTGLPRLKTESKSTDLGQSDWDRICFVCTKYQKELNEGSPSFEFCLKFLLMHQVNVNKQLLMNSSAFHRLTNRRFRGVVAK